MALIICPKCGKENQGESIFCESCGARLDMTGTSPAENWEKMSEEMESSNFKNEHELENFGEEPKKKFLQTTSGKVALAVILASAIVVIAVVIVILYRSGVFSQGPVGLFPMEESSVEESEPELATEDIIYDINNLTEEQQNMLPLMDSLIYITYYAGVEAYGVYDWNNSDYVWDALWMFLDDYSYMFTEEGYATYDNLASRIWVSEDLLKECASAMFAEFTGELPAHEFSDFSEPFGGNIVKDGYYYGIGLSDRGEFGGFAISSWVEHADGSCSVEVKELAYNEEYVNQNARYVLELVKDSYTESYVNPLYTYSVAGMEITYIEPSDATPLSDNYILPDSDTRYYTASELSGLSKSELRLARNEIYARHGRIFDSSDLQEYFESQSWYHGTIRAEDFSNNLLNSYENANIKLIQELENGSWRESYAEYIENLENEFDWAGEHKYALIYIDDNNVPELYVAGIAEAEGDRICFVNKSDEVEDFFPGRTYGIGYVERSSKFCNYTSHMGYGGVGFYELKNGSVSIVEVDPACAWNEDTHYMTASEFYATWGDAMDWDAVCTPWDNACPADEMVAILRY